MEHPQQLQPQPSTEPRRPAMEPVTFKDKAILFWRRHLRPLVFIVVIFCAFRSAVADWNDVPTGSMKPTILEGDRIFVNKLAYDLKIPFLGTQVIRWGDPARGDVVVFYSPRDGTRLVKRVVAVPGDKVELRNNRLIINDVEATDGALDAKFIEPLVPADRNGHKFSTETVAGRAHPLMEAIMPPSQAPRTFAPYLLPEGRFFMMGDNRDNSGDSRIFGPVPRGNIVGRASAIVWSLDFQHHYAPRWSRFFRSLP